MKQNLTQKTGSTIIYTDPQILLDESFDIEENLYARGPD